MADLTPKQITPGDASRGSVVHASDADTVGVLSRSHNEEDISRLQSAFNIYNASFTYIENDVVIDSSGVLVKANKTTTGVFVPADWDLVVGIESLNSDTAKNQTMSGGTGIDIVDSSPDHSIAIDATVVTLTDTQTLTNKTLTAPLISDFTNATHDHEDAVGGGQLTATDALNATGTQDSTTFLRGDNTWAVPSDVAGITSINSDTTAAQIIASGTGLDLVDATNTHTLSIDNTVVTLTGAQTLTNKTLTAPSISDFTSATHDHENTAGGGTLTATNALDATGTQDSTTFLRGDNTWAVPPDESGVTSINTDTTAAQIIAAGTGLDLVDATNTHTLSIDSSVVTLTGTQTLTNKTIDGDENTILDINETQQTVSVGAAGTVLTSNGVGSAPTYQSQGVQTRTNTTIVADQAITGNGDTDITGLTVTLPTVTGKHALITFNINFSPDENDKDVVFRVNDNSVVVNSFSRAAVKDLEYTGICITYVAQMAGQVVKAVCARDGGADPANEITILGATAPSSSMQVLELA